MSAFRLIVTLCLIMKVVTGLHRIPLTRISHPVKQTNQTREGHPVQLLNKYNVSYVAEVKIGDDRRNFSVLVDTGSSNLLIPSTECLNCGARYRFDCRNKSSYITKLSYGWGETVGGLCTDNVTVSGLAVKSQEFTVMLEEDSFFRSVPYIDGILGMGFKENAIACKCITPKCVFFEQVSTCNYPPFVYHPATVFQNLVNQSVIQENVFSFYINGSNERGSELTLGGSDNNHYSGNLTYAYIPDYRYEWLVPMDGLHFGKTDAGFCGLSTCFALIDTAIPFIAVPRDRANEIAYLSRKLIIEIIRLPAYADKEELIFRVGLPAHPGNVDDVLSTFESIFITIANQTFEIKPSDYLTLQGNYYYIELRVWPFDFWVLGTNFLRKVYTQFDMGNRRIGFAPAK